MDVVYCQQWSYARKRALRIMSPQQARARHDQRKHYAALVGGAEAPKCVIGLTGEWVFVSFMDPLLREYLRYDFHEYEPGRLFLKVATFREFSEDCDEPSSAKLFNFGHDGHMIVEDADLTKQTVTELRGVHSLEGHWEAFPPFGEYTPLCRQERGVFPEEPGA